MPYDIPVIVVVRPYHCLDLRHASHILRVVPNVHHRQTFPIVSDHRVLRGALRPQHVTNHDVRYILPLRRRPLRVDQYDLYATDEERGGEAEGIESVDGGELEVG